TISVWVGSARTSSPLPIAPTGLIRSWQTNEHIMAAKSDAPISITLAMVLSLLPASCRESLWPLYRPRRAAQRIAPTRSRKAAPFPIRSGLGQKDARVRTRPQALPGLRRPARARDRACREGLAIAHRIEQEER